MLWLQAPLIVVDANLQQIVHEPDVDLSMAVDAPQQELQEVDDNDVVMNELGAGGMLANADHHQKADVIMIEDLAAAHPVAFVQQQQHEEDANMDDQEVAEQVVEPQTKRRKGRPAKKHGSATEQAKKSITKKRQPNLNPPVLQRPSIRALRKIVSARTNGEQATWADYAQFIMPEPRDPDKPPKRKCLIEAKAKILFGVVERNCVRWELLFQEPNGEITHLRCSLEMCANQVFSSSAVISLCLDDGGPEDQHVPL